MSTQTKKESRLIVVLRIVLPIVFILLGVLAARRIYETRPIPKRRPPMRVEPLVEVTAVTITRHTPVVRAYGEIVASRQVDLQPLVAGAVTAVHPAFREGGIIPAGDTVLTIDPRDFAQAVARAEAAVARATLEVAVEQGAGEVAHRERELLGRDAGLSTSEEALIQRDPHRVAARASLAAAEADLAQARLNLERTTVTAPFTALVQTRMIERGGLASPQRAVARIVDADTYWVRVSVPVDRLRPVLAVPPTSTPSVTVIASDGLTAMGRLIGHAGTVDARGRMAALLVSIPGPAASTNGAAHLLGDYVEAHLPALPLDHVIQLPQSALRDGDQVWLADSNNQLAIRSVDVAWRDHDHVYIATGLNDGDRVITTALSSGVAGTSLRLAGETAHD